MDNLSKAEEQLMEFIWQQEKAFFKDLVEMFPDPKPANTTIATLLKRLQEKAFIAYTLHGNSREYYPLVSKADYFSRELNGIIKTFFNDSALQFASFFTTSSKLTQAELQDLKKIVDQEINKKNE